MKANEKGFSLVELIVSMAILMIAGVAMLGFFSYCVNQYTRSSQETALQIETQTTQNQIRELILQTNVGIALNPVKNADGNDRSGRQLLLYSWDNNGDPVRIRIDIDYTGHTLYFQEFGMDRELARKEQNGLTVSDNEVWSIVRSEKQVLASNVEDWEVTLYDAKGDPITDTSGINVPEPKEVKIWIRNRVNDREYEATHAVSIRNSICASDKMSRDVFSEE